MLIFQLFANNAKREAIPTRKKTQNRLFLLEFNAEMNKYQNRGIGSRSKILRFVVGDSNASSAKDIYQTVPFQKETNRNTFQPVILKLE